MTKSRATAPSCGSALPMNALVRSSVCVYVGVGLHLVLCSLNCQLLFPTFLTTPPPPLLSRAGAQQFERALHCLLM